MANIRGIELASEIYDLEDTSARNTATSASQTATTASQTATEANQTATQAGQTAAQASQTATQADEKIGTLADLKTTAKANLVAAINEINAAVGGTHTQKTVSFESGFSNLTGNRVDYVSGIKALVFSVGGTKNTEIVAEETAFTVSVSEPFIVGGYGFIVPIVYRNSTSGATAIGGMTLLKSGNTITARLSIVPSGTWQEFRMLGNVVLSL